MKTDGKFEGVDEAVKEWGERRSADLEYMIKNKTDEEVQKVDAEKRGA